MSGRRATLPNPRSTADVHRKRRSEPLGKMVGAWYPSRSMLQNEITPESSVRGGEPSSLPIGDASGRAPTGAYAGGPWRPRDSSRIACRALGRGLLWLIAASGCASAPVYDELPVDTDGEHDGSEPHNDAAPDESGDDDDDALDDVHADEADSGTDSQRSDASPSRSSLGSSQNDAGTQTTSGIGSSLASRDSGANTPDAATAKDAGPSDSGRTETDARPAPTCNPSTCSNNCLLLSRCCDVHDECACEEPWTGQCTLPSLPGPSLPGF